MASYDIIDLGTKHGGAIAVARHNLAKPAFHHKFFNMTNPLRRRCLAVDRSDSHLKLLAQSYPTEKLDLNVGFPDSATKLYLAFNVLEHLKSEARSKHVLNLMLSKATQGVWLRIPSFEEDKTAAAVLDPLGLCWHWTTWRHHTSSFKISHVREVLASIKQPFTMKITTVSLIKDTSHPSVVPKPDEGVEFGPYKKSMGPKPKVTFAEPLVGEWDIHIRWDQVATKRCKKC